MFRFSTLLVSLFAFFVAVFCASQPLLADPDIWWHLHNAALLVGHRAFIHVDSYTFTAGGKPWINPEWLSELPYLAAWRLFRYRGLEVWAIATMEAVVLGVCYLCWQRTRNIKTALAATVLFLPLVAVSMGPRTLMSGWLCLIAEMAILWDYRQRTDRVWWLPGLFCVWINAHGSWPIGMVFLGVFIAAGLGGATQGSVLVVRWTAEQRTKLLLVLAACVVALFVNPYRWRLVAYPFHILGHTLTVNTVEEWQTLNFHVFRGKFTFVLLAVLAVASLLRRRMWLAQDLAFLLIAVLAGLTYSRLLVALGIVVLPLLAREFGVGEPVARKGQRDIPVLNFALIAAGLGMLLTHVPSQASLQAQVAKANPEKALAWMRAVNVQGPILNDFSWGGYLEWNDPSNLYFIDTRADVFDEYGVFQEYLDATKMVRPVAVMDKYRIRYVVFPKDAEIVYLLTHTPGWTVRYRDDVAVVLERDEGGSAP